MEKQDTNIKQKLRQIIFEAETPGGKIFDLVLLIVILFSTLLVVIESIPSVHHQYGPILEKLEWVITIIFTFEYFLRIYCINQPKSYIFSFYGLIDLLAVLPSYLGLLLASHYPLTVIRAFRFLRIFRILKLGRFLVEAKELRVALFSSRYKITVFLLFTVITALLAGSLMYIVEGDRGDINSIPMGVYWAIVTMTTVGYGDVVPVTSLGKFISSFLMILGYAIIAVPTGIISNEIAKVFLASKTENTRTCAECSHEGHDPRANFCKMCGTTLKTNT